MLFCLVSFFAVVAGVNAIMMTFAVTTFGGVETASSYQAGVQFAREEAAAEAQQARHWQVTATLRPETNGTTAGRAVGARFRADSRCPALSRPYP